MDFLISRLVDSAGRVAGRAAAPLGMMVAISISAVIAYGSFVAGIFILLENRYEPAVAWFVLAGTHAIIASVLAIYLAVMMRRRRQRAHSAELAALALAIAPRLIAKSPIGSLLAIGAIAYVIAKTKAE